VKILGHGEIEMPRGKPVAGFRRTESWAKKNNGVKVDYSKNPPQELVNKILSGELDRKSPEEVAKVATAISNVKAFEASKVSNVTPIKPNLSVVVSNESEEQILKRINDAFDVLGTLVDDALSEDSMTRSLIVSGPAGVGKSYLIEDKLTAWDPDRENWTIIKGTIRPTGLFTTLYEFKDPGQIIVIDDGDSVFDNEMSLNFLKAVCDSSYRRTVSYLSQVELYSNLREEEVPKTFDFYGTIIFISNHDFDGLIEGCSKLTPHLRALMSRSYYIDLAMKTERDCFIRIKDLINRGMLKNLSKEQANEVLDFIHENISIIRELSLRTALKIGGLRVKQPKIWRQMALTTCCKK
jgi:hypothetical protein